MQIACISVPQRGTVPLTAGLPPRPPGAAPPPLPLRSGRFPCYLPSGRSVCKNHGGASAGRAKRKPAVGRWATACSCPWGNPKGSVGARKPRPVFSFRVEDPQAGVAKPPQNPQGSRLSVGKCSESTYRRKWQNGGMAHFAILRCRSSSPRWRSIAP